MESPEDVEQMLALHKLGWGIKKIAKRLNTSRNTVRRYVRAGRWEPYTAPRRNTILGPHLEKVRELFFLHHGNARVVKEELDILGIHASVRIVQEATSLWRRELTKRAEATVRFETPPGKQLQIDFGELKVCIGGEWLKIHFFVATLAFSRRIYVRAFLQETQNEWLQGLEGTFYHFGGVTREVLLDNPKACVIFHNSRTAEIRFNDTFLAFCRYWGFRPRACAPYRARTKGKDERSVGFLKSNGIAGRSFESWAHLENHLEEWMRKVDQRIHGTTHEQPILRFEREDLIPLFGRPPFIQSRELRRKVHTDACVEVECNRYSVPWRHIGQTVTVRFSDQTLIISLGTQELVRHPQCFGRHQTRLDPHHLVGVVGAPPLPPGELSRSLTEYEEAIGQ